MTRVLTSMLLCSLLLLQACNKEPPPRSVQEFLENSIMLEAVMVRCAQNRTETRYEAECVNARQAVSMIEAREERARREALEAQSTRKRNALRRTQQAAAEARRRSAEAARRREEADYLAQFGELPPEADDVDADSSTANAPSAMIPDAGGAAADAPLYDESAPASDGGNAPIVEQSPSSDLDAVRDELRRRTEESSN